MGLFEWNRFIKSTKNLHPMNKIKVEFIGKNNFFSEIFRWIVALGAILLTVMVVLIPIFVASK